MRERYEESGTEAQEGMEEATSKSGAGGGGGEDTGG